MIDVAIGISEVMNPQSRRAFSDILCLRGAPALEFVCLCCSILNKGK